MKNPKLLIYAIGVVWAAALAKSFEFEPPYFRPWEILIAGSGTHFAKNRTVEMTEYGNLGYRHWIRELQRPHETTFTTDGWGFRNAVAFSEAPRVVIIGDSFVVGLGLSDDETLPAQLTKLLDEPVYNYGAQYEHGPPLFMSDPRFQQYPPRVVVWAPSTTALVPVVFPKPPVGRNEQSVFAFAAPFARPYLAIGQRFAHFREVAERDNGLGHFAKHAYHETSYRLFGLRDAILPDGEPALIEPLDKQLITKTPDERGIGAIAESIAAFRDKMHASGTELIFAPVPESGDIYADLFPAEDRARIPSPSFLDVLFAEFARARVRAIDLRPAFVRERSPYLYLRDDTHWTARGVHIAAQELTPSIRAVLTSTTAQ